MPALDVLKAGMPHREMSAITWCYCSHLIEDGDQLIPGAPPLRVHSPPATPIPEAHQADVP